MASKKSGTSGIMKRNAGAGGSYAGPKSTKAKTAAKAKAKATGQTAESSMDAVTRRYKYSETAGKTPSGDPKKTSKLYDKVSGVTRTTETYPNNKAPFKSRSTYTTNNAKTAAAAKRAGRNSTYMQNLSAGGRSKKK